MHDDLLERDFTAETVNSKWLPEITEHPTGEGLLYLCAIKDCASNRIVGYSLDARMALRARGRRAAERDRASLARGHHRALGQG